MMKRKGFTLLEAIVVTAVAAAVLLPALARARSNARRTVCATNLKTIGMTYAIYAADYNDELPPTGKGAGDLQWLCDQTQSTSDVLAAPSSGAAALKPADMQRILYCPQNENQNPEAIIKWGDISVWGYAATNDRGPDAKSMPTDFPKRNPPLAYHAKFSATANPSQQELAFDWIITDHPDKADFSKPITRNGKPNLTFTTSHLNGKTPAGANILAFDGHVEWRSFNANNGVAIKQSGGANPPYFWLPNP